MVHINKTITTHGSEEVGQKKNIFIACLSANLFSHYENRCGVYSKAENRTSTRSCFDTLKHIPKDSVSYSRDTCSTMGIVAQFLIAPN